MPIEEQIKILQGLVTELSERFSFHSHSGMDSREIDYRRLLNKPISNEKTIDGALGSGGISIGDNGSLKAGQTAYDTGIGFWLEYNNGTPRLSIGNSAGDKLLWTGTALSITGSFTATAGTIGGFTITATTVTATNLTLTSGAANTANIAVGTGANTAGLNSPNAAGDIAFWAGATFANRATAPFRVEADGSVVTTDITITGLQAGSSVDGQYLLANSVGSAAANLALRSWTQTSAFSVTDADTVAWGAGTFTLSDGTAYSIGAGNTGNMSARTYIYLDIAVSTTAYQVTTTAANAVGNGKKLIASAINGTDEAEFIVFGGLGGLNINASSIVASSITANEIAANTITAAKMNVSQLSAIAADLGAITAGSMVISATGFIRSGQTAYNTGTGYYIEANSGTPRISIGDGTTGNSMLWDGTNLYVNGSIISNQDIFGDGSDGNVTISGDTSLSSDMFYNNLTINTGVTLNPAGYRIFVKGTLTISGTGSIARTPANGGNGTGFGAGSWSGATGGAGGVAGATLAAGSIPGGIAASNGGQGGDVVFDNGEVGDAGVVGVDAAKSVGASAGVTGAAGGKGGDTTVAGAGSNGGSAGGAGAQSGTVYNKIHTSFAAYRLYDDTGTAYLTSSPGSGGSGGGGSGAYDNGAGPKAGAGAGGGASGSNGAIVLVFARIITGTGTIKAPGGTGGNGGRGGDSDTGGAAQAGGGGGGGAGSGGSGGVVITVNGTLSGVTSSATGGAAGSVGSGGAGRNGGTSGSSGSAGNTGSTGITISLQV